MANYVQNTGNVLGEVKNYLQNDSVKKRFNSVLGSKAPQFMSSLVSAVTGNYQLQRCNPQSIMAAAFVAASFDLPIDKNLGLAALVPYNNDCQFQLMYKGFVQLAIRTGAYERMNCSEVYEDELEMYNPITGECKFVEDFNQCVDRKNGDDSKIVGYYAWFRLKTGFVKELYMSKEEILNHANKYSKAFRYDQREGKKSSTWSTNFDAMAKKTVLKLLLSRWGMLSIKLQKALQDDQKTFNADGTACYGDNQPDEPPVLEQPQEPQFNQISEEKRLSKAADELTINAMNQ